MSEEARYNVRSYYVRFYLASHMHKAWCAAHDIWAEFYIDYDGGNGYNFHIIKFRTKAGALAFMAQFGTYGDNPFWVADTEGDCHVLPPGR